jgi:hypothetical protein
VGRGRPPAPRLHHSAPYRHLRRPVLDRAQRDSVGSEGTTKSLLETYVACGAARRRQRLGRCCGASRLAPGAPGAIALPLPLSTRRS